MNCIQYYNSTPVFKPIFSNQPEVMPREGVSWFWTFVLLYHFFVAGYFLMTKYRQVASSSFDSLGHHLRCIK